MAVSTLTEQFDNLYATTWQKMKSEISNAAFDQVAFYNYLRKKGGLKRDGGGRWIGVPVEYAQSSTVQGIAKGGTVTLQDKEILTTARFLWYTITDQIVRYRDEDRENRGAARIIDLIRSKVDNARKSVAATMETKLFTAQTGNYPDGLPDIVATTSTNTYGNIDRSSYTWWANQTTDFGTGNSFSVYGIPKMRTMWNDCIYGSLTETPDVLVTTQTIHEWYEDECLEPVMFRPGDSMDLGIPKVLSFKGVPVIWSIDATANAIYFLNTEYFKLMVDEAWDFVMGDWIAIANQPFDRVCHIVVTYNLICTNPRTCGVLHTIDTA